MTHPSNDTQDRLTALETQLAHAQRLYEQLNEVVTEQAMQADRTQRRVSELENQYKSMKEKPHADSDPLDEKPPHY